MIPPAPEGPPEAAADRASGFRQTRRELLTSLSVGLPALGWASAQGDPFRTVVGRVRSQFIQEVSHRDAPSFMARQSAEGGWPDVDYRDRSLAAWPAMRHLERARAIAASYTAPSGQLHREAAARIAVERSLRSWLRIRPQSDNWWFNTIGQQIALMHILMLLDGELPGDLVVEVLGLFPELATIRADQRTGQNLVWYATQGIVRGALLKQSALIASSSDQLQSMLKITTEEGIQSDLSFHQHGPQLYSGGYGLAFLQDMAKIIGWLAQTPWSFKEDRVLLLADYALEGIMPLVRHNWLDWGARGREIARVDSPPRPALVLGALKALAPHAPARRAPLLEAVQQLESNRPPSIAYSKAYWRSDFVAHQTQKGYFSIKAASPRTVGTESSSGENQLGYWLPFGTTWVVNCGNEYQSILPVLDWSMLPGVTAPAVVPPFSGYLRHKLGESAVLSDGGASLVALQLNTQHTRGTKMWFVFDDTLVAVGCALQCDAPLNLRTTLDQTLWSGGAQTDRGPVETLLRDDPYAQMKWLWHAGTLYSLLDEGAARISLGARAQPGKDPANLPYGVSGAKASVLTLWIDHGRQPRPGSSYAYTIRHGVKTAREAARSVLPKVLINTPNMQAVSNIEGNLIGAVFHQPGSLALPDQSTLQVSMPCLLILRAQNADWSVSAVPIGSQAATCSLGLAMRGQLIDSKTINLPAIHQRSVDAAFASTLLRRAAS